MGFPQNPPIERKDSAPETKKHCRDEDSRLAAACCPGTHQHHKVEDIHNDKTDAIPEGGRRDRSDHSQARDSHYFGTYRHQAADQSSDDCQGQCNDL